MNNETNLIQQLLAKTKAGTLRWSAEYGSVLSDRGVIYHTNVRLEKDSVMISIHGYKEFSLMRLRVLPHYCLYLDTEDVCNDITLLQPLFDAIQASVAENNLRNQINKQTALLNLYEKTLAAVSALQTKDTQQC